MQRQQKRTSNPFRSIMGIVFLVLAVMAVFWIAKGIFTILSYLTPVLLIATLIIDHKVIIDYGKFLGKLFQRNPLYGIGGILLSFIASPVVAVYLFGKAMLKRKVRKMQTHVEEQTKGKYTDYNEVAEEEEVEFELKDEEEIIPLEIPKIERRLKQQERNSYDDLFDNI